MGVEGSNRQYSLSGSLSVPQVSALAASQILADNILFAMSHFLFFVLEMSALKMSSTLFLGLSIPVISSFWCLPSEAATSTLLEPRYGFN